MAGNYWKRVTNTYLGRRRLLALSGAGLGAASLTLMGCGGDDDSEQSGASNRGLLSESIDSSKQAKKGGIIQTVTGQEPGSLDALAPPSEQPARVAMGYVYGRLLKFKPGIVTAPTGEVEGDFAESWEYSPDKLQVTLKLRPGVKLDSRAPTNGRELTAEDVMFSVNKIRNVSIYGGELFSDLNPAAPIASITSPDRSTITIKLVAPNTVFLTMLASGRFISIQPVEADGKFDPRIEMRGWGPWRLKEFRASSHIEYEANPDYYQKGIPYAAGIRMPFLSEYAAVVSQFRGKNIWVGGNIRTADALELKSSFPELLVAQNEFTRGPMRMKFGIQDLNAPTADERVRQALSMLMNRDLILDVLKEVEPMRAAGVPVESRWHSCLPAGWVGYWLDPKGKDFGPNAQYYQYNVAEAKKLIEAAGYSNGFPLDFMFTPTQYGDAYTRYVETLAGEIESSNLIKVTRKPTTYTEFLPVVVRGKGQYTGVSFQLWGAEPHPVEALRVQYHSQGGIGIDQPPFKPEPDIDDLIAKMTREFDEDKLKSMVQEFQRIMAKRQRTIPEPGDAPGLNVTWPWVGNAISFRGYDQFAGAGAERMPYLWVDESKRTS